jgi:hypothetical protein
MLQLSALRLRLPECGIFRNGFHCRLQSSGFQGNKYDFKFDKTQCLSL